VFTYDDLVIYYNMININIHKYNISNLDKEPRPDEVNEFLQFT
jgi:hypothetical protein